MYSVSAVWSAVGDRPLGKVAVKVVPKFAQVGCGPKVGAAAQYNKKVAKEIAILTLLWGGQA